jgi:hypothetical protein
MEVAAVALEGVLRAARFPTRDHGATIVSTEDARRERMSSGRYAYQILGIDRPWQRPDTGAMMLGVAPRQIIEAGLLLGMLGAAIIVIGSAKFLRSPSADHSIRQRWWTLVGATAIGVGFAVQLVGQIAR